MLVAVVRQGFLAHTVEQAGTTIEHQRPLQERVLDKGATDEGGQWHHGLLVQTDGLGLAGENAQKHVGEYCQGETEVVHRVTHAIQPHGLHEGVPAAVVTGGLLGGLLRC